VPSLKEAEALVVNGDWTFGSGVTVRGKAELDGGHGRVEAGTVLGEDPAAE
jgi:UTP--glucose-1-phosphate uridylyltransferase